MHNTIYIVRHKDGSFLFQLIVHAHIHQVVTITKSYKVKLAVSRLEKDDLTWWRQYVSQHNNALANLDWDTFKNKIGSAFEDIDKELRLRKRLKNLQQTRSAIEYTKVVRSIVLALGDRAPDEDALVFTNIDGLKEDV